MFQPLASRKLVRLSCESMREPVGRKPAGSYRPQAGKNLYGGHAVKKPESRKLSGFADAIGEDVRSARPSKRQRNLARETGRKPRFTFTDDDTQVRTDVEGP